MRTDYSTTLQLTLSRTQGLGRKSARAFWLRFFERKVEVKSIRKGEHPRAINP